MLAEVKNRGTRDVLMVICDGLKGLPDAIAQVWPQAVTQTCIVHYPDTVVMPIRGRLVLAGGGEPGWRYRHNHRASRKARSWSGGL